MSVTERNITVKTLSESLSDSEFKQVQERLTRILQIFDKHEVDTNPRLLTDLAAYAKEQYELGIEQGETYVRENPGDYDLRVMP